MPNTPVERQKIKLAISLIANRYANWIVGNAKLLAIMGANDNQLDVLVKFLDEPQFLINYQLSNGMPPVGCQVNGFFDTLNAPFQIYINRTRASDSTLIHELLHLLTHQNFDRMVSTRLNEGVTEYFTRKVQGTIDPNNNNLAGFLQARQSYQTEFQSVNATRGTIKNIINPMLPEIRSQPIKLGRHRDPNFMVDPAGGVNTNDFVKRAYFRGETAMINLIKENSNLH